MGDERLASSRTRVFQYIPHLTKHGISSKIIIYFDRLTRNSTLVPAGFKVSNNDTFKKSYKTVVVGLLKSIARVPFRFIAKIYTVSVIIRIFFYSFFYDILFIQKVILPVWAIRLNKRLYLKIVFDFDDAIFTGKQNRISERAKIRSNFFETLRCTELAIVENAYNAEIVKPYCASLIITGPIDTDRYAPLLTKQHSPVLVIGWIGSPSTTKYLFLLQNVFSRICEKYENVIIKTIGAGYIDAKDFRLEQATWSLETEVEELQKFDIGIMPLTDDDWTRGKGGYKLLQYMALGIPSVASPVGVNNELIIDGVNGYLANTEDEWFVALSTLIDNEVLRKNMGRQARDIAENKYSFYASTQRLIRCLEL
jgi:glycosyltransferase involved in cell wall biosynthesis